MWLQIILQHTVIYRWFQLVIEPMNWDRSIVNSEWHSSVLLQPQCTLSFTFSGILIILVRKCYAHLSPTILEAQATISQDLTVATSICYYYCFPYQQGKWARRVLDQGKSWGFCAPRLGLNHLLWTLIIPTGRHRHTGQFHELSRYPYYAHAFCSDHVKSADRRRHFHCQICAILASQKGQVWWCWICHKSSANGFAILYCKNCQIISYCVRTGDKFWTVPHGLTLKCFFVYYQGTECQRADWKNHKETCQKTVQHRAILKGIGSTLETDKFLEWYSMHRKTVYWAIYHGKLYGEPDPLLMK